MKKGNHYLKRIQELGFAGAVQRIQKTSHRLSNTAWRSIQANLKRFRKLSNREMLHNCMGQWQDYESFLNHLSNRPDSSYLFPIDSVAAARETIRQRFPNYAEQIITEADEICSGRLTLLGHTVHYTNGIQWNKDPLSDFRWPSLDRETMIEKYCWPKDRPCDLILVWELNRHQHFVILAIAYLLTGNEKYTDTFVSHLTGWIESNPVEHGINWTYSLEISVRVMAWIIAFQLFRHSPHFHSDTAGEMIKSLYQQVSFVSSHPQTGWASVPNNHLLTESAALVVAGAVFPEFRAAYTWRNSGMTTFLQQIQEQTHPDGVNREQAIGYHRIIAELLIILSSLGRRKLIRDSEIIDATLEKMLNYVMYSITPDGSVPMWGDADFGRMLGARPAENYWDFKPLLAAGAALLKKMEYRFTAGEFDPEFFLLLGSSSLDAWDELSPVSPGQTSMAFPDGGLNILRDGWMPTADAAFFRCGPFGLGGAGFCSHAHCDLLSVQLWLMGKPILVDAGTYSYHGSLRENFRSTSFHNTCMIDGREQSRPKGDDFNWLDAPRAACLHWNSSSVTGSLDMGIGLQQTRKLEFKNKGICAITDSIKGSGEHEVTWHFHFSPKFTLHNEMPGSGRLMVKNLDETIAILFVPAGINLKIQTGWYSEQYHQKRENTCLKASWKGIIPEKGMDFSWEIQYIGKLREKDL